MDFSRWTSPGRPVPGPQKYRSCGIFRQRRNFCARGARGRSQGADTEPWFFGQQRGVTNRAQCFATSCFAILPPCPWRCRIRPAGPSASGSQRALPFLALGAGVKPPCLSLLRTPPCRGRRQRQGLATGPCDTVSSTCSAPDIHRRHGFDPRPARRFADETLRERHSGRLSSG